MTAPHPSWRRRDVLAAAVALGPALAAQAGGGAQLLAFSDRPQQLATPLDALGTLLTPTDAFFVRSHFGPPAYKPGRVLAVGGMVQTPLALDVKSLARFPKVTVTAVLQCAGNGRAMMQPAVPGVQWAHGAVGQASWTGVRVADVLAAAGIQPGGAHLHILGADRPPRPATPPFMRSIPLEKALALDTLIATHMNGQPLTLQHGAPMRLVVPGWAGDHWMKWLARLDVAAQEADTFFVKTAYRIPPQPVPPGTAVAPDKMEPVAVFPVKSLLASPLDGSQVKAGMLDITGMAYSGVAAVAAVEVSVDGGQTFVPARLEGAGGVGRGQVFHARLPVAPPAITVVARARDAAGNTQPQQGVWNPSGYHWNGWHAVTARVVP